MQSGRAASNPQRAGAPRKPDQGSRAVAAVTAPSISVKRAVAGTVAIAVS